jgi:hypothetical protein
MPEVTVTYKKPETLKILKGLAKYFDFKIITGKKESLKVKDLTIIPGNAEIKPDDLSDIFFNKKLDAKTLREQAWQRKG